MEKHIEILKERFLNDSLMALATIDEKGVPWVRTIDDIFYQDSFYTITLYQVIDLFFVFLLIRLLQKLLVVIPVILNYLHQIYNETEHLHLRHFLF